jgi:hypothetical protein
MYFLAFLFAALAFGLSLSYSRFMRGDYRNGVVFLFLMGEAVAVFYAGRIVERYHMSDRAWFSSLFDHDADKPEEAEQSSQTASKANDFRPQLQDRSQIAWEGFDVDAPEYPEELDIALQAWRAVANKSASGSVKERLTIWLNDAYPSLSGAARERIIVMCNWDRTGGRPKI